MKRFYKEATAGASPDPDRPGFVVLLDGRPVKTPRKATMAVGSAKLAEAIAEEWAAQAEVIAPLSMPLTSMACTSLDIVAERRQESEAEIAAFGEYDLICYRAEQPPGLVERQGELWQPLLDWTATELQAPLVTTSGLLAAAQPAEALAALGGAVAEHDDMAMAALASAVKAAGSLVIGLALSAGRIDAEAAFAAAELHETYQIEAWGEDPEAARRRVGVRADLEAAARFLGLLRA